MRTMRFDQRSLTLRKERTSAMKSAIELNLNASPVGNLGIVALKSSQTMGEQIDAHIVSWRKQREHELLGTPHLIGYDQDSFLIPIATPRFGSGEAKGQIFSSVRGMDLYVLVDVCNYSITYTMNGVTNRMSPDDHFQDLKRIISAAGGKARRITVIMPYLYESRQHKREGRQSLDCAMALQELIDMGVDQIITFDAHDPRVQNAIPLHGFESYQSVYQFIKGIFRKAPDFSTDPSRLLIVSPDEGSMKRAVYMSNVLGVDMGMFYKRRDYTRIVNGHNPVIANEFLGPDVSGKDIVLIDDMISSGSTVLEISAELKKRKAGRIFICATFGLFTNGFKPFDEAHEKGVFDFLLTTDLIYQPPELLERSYYTSCRMSRYLALIIDTMNHDESVSQLLDPIDRINNFLLKHEEKAN